MNHDDSLFRGSLNTLLITDLSHLDTLHLEGKCIITNVVRTESCISVDSARQAPAVTADV